MIRMALLLEYHGQQFCGWQYQTGLRTVQGELQAGLSKIANENIQVVCAGRTDRGVHALGQVVHFDTQAVRPMHGWLSGSNRYLAKDLVIRAIQPVPKTFHARFSAIRRSYRYTILNQTVRSALQEGLMTCYHKPLDADAMHQAAQHLIGTHDFSALRAKECQAKSPIRTLYDIRVWRHQQHVSIEVTANAFLHHMVRNIVGTLVKVGTGHQPTHWIAEVLHGRDRTKAGVTAPPDGLYLKQIFYANQVFSDEFYVE